MSANEWVAFGGGLIGAIIGLSIIVGFIYRRIIHPLNNLITRELTPNGGSSIKDSISNMEKKLTENTQLTVTIHNELSAHIDDAEVHRKFTEEVLPRAEKVATTLLDTAAQTALKLIEVAEQKVSEREGSDGS